IFIEFFMFYIVESYVNMFFFFFINDTATTEIYTLSLHDALPIPTSTSGSCQSRSTSKSLLKWWTRWRRRRCGPDPRENRAQVVAAARLGQDSIDAAGEQARIVDVGRVPGDQDDIRIRAIGVQSLRQLRTGQVAE